MSTIHCLVNLLVRISIDQNQFQRLLSSSNPSIAILSQRKKKKILQMVRVVVEHSFNARFHSRMTGTMVTDSFISGQKTLSF